MPLKTITLMRKKSEPPKAVSRQTLGGGSCGEVDVDYSMPQVSHSVEHVFFWQLLPALLRLYESVLAGRIVARTVFNFIHRKRFVLLRDRVLMCPLLESSLLMLMTAGAASAIVHTSGVTSHAVVLMSVSNPSAFVIIW